MGEAKRRKKLGIPPREKKMSKEKSINGNFLSKSLRKYPYLPYIIGFSVLIILIIDLINYYK
tara:strand:+ start:3154 stop:3339 length:186 start_codon:yes stop_codon:yes gene_type:complete